MELRKHLQPSANPHPHIGNLVWKVMNSKRISQAELARKMQISSSSMSALFTRPSMQFGILWNIGIALEYDFLTEIANNYPATIPRNEKSKIVSALIAKEKEVEDLEKEIRIYKSALGIREK